MPGFGTTPFGGGPFGGGGSILLEVIESSLVDGGEDSTLDPVQDLLLDAAGDVTISDDVKLVSGLPAIAQSIRIRLSFVMGEWFLDREAGVPYYEEVFVKNPRLVVLREVFREQLDDTPGVDEVRRLDLRFESAERLLRVTFKVGTDVGELTETLNLAVAA